jgi:hypothetical protein
MSEVSFNKKINSIEKLNLEQLIDKIWGEYRKGEYLTAVKLSQKGLIGAFKTGNTQWVRMFDALYKEMITSYQEGCESTNIEENVELDTLRENFQEFRLNLSEH